MFFERAQVLSAIAEYFEFIQSLPSSLLPPLIIIIRDMIFQRSTCCLRPIAKVWVGSTCSTYTSQAASKVNKSVLTELRQKTGFSFFQCNNALKACNNDVVKAEQWLHEQAEKEGWKKAAKLQTRSTGQGLVGVLAENNYAALVQVKEIW